MPIYFLHIRNGDGFTEAEEGEELADVAAARESAIAGIRSLLSQEVQEGRFDLRGRIEITDEAGGLVAAVRFDEAVELRVGEPPE